jgi:hypothetical protein
LTAVYAIAVARVFRPGGLLPPSRKFPLSYWLILSSGANRFRRSDAHMLRTRVRKYDRNAANQ